MAAASEGAVPRLRLTHRPATHDFPAACLSATSVPPQRAERRHGRAGRCERAWAPSPPYERRRRRAERAVRIVRLPPADRGRGGAAARQSIDGRVTGTRGRFLIVRSRGDRAASHSDGETTVGWTRGPALLPLPAPLRRARRHPGHRRRAGRRRPVAGRPPPRAAPPRSEDVGRFDPCHVSQKLAEDCRRSVRFRHERARVLEVWVALVRADKACFAQTAVTSGVRSAPTDPLRGGRSRRGRARRPISVIVSGSSCRP